MATSNKLNIEKDANNVYNTHLGIDAADVSGLENGRFVSNVPNKFYIKKTSSVPIDAMADYVVECGRIASGGVGYGRKGNSGIAECWYGSQGHPVNTTNTTTTQDTAISPTTGTAGGNAYIRGRTNFSNPAYPVTFIEKPRVFLLNASMSDPGTDTTGYTIRGIDFGPSTYSKWSQNNAFFWLNLIRASDAGTYSTGKQACDICVLYRGRWK